MSEQQLNGMFDEIGREYERERFFNLEERRRRREEIFAKIPAYRQLVRETPRRSLQMLYESLSSEEGTGRPAAFDGAFAKKEEEELTAKKERLLEENGFPKDYLSPLYTCADCEDTGYIRDAYGARSIRCHCFTKKLADHLSRTSGLGELLKDADFSGVSLKYYQGEDLENFRRTLTACREFADSGKDGYKNFFFYGTIGTGKSFLSCCVADAFLKSGRQVLYFSSGVLFDKLAERGSSAAAREESAAFRSCLYDADLLILDDLGTEWVNNFVFSEFFKLVNERILRKRSTIISTNLTLQNLTEIYSERLLSRITSSYMLCKFSGPDIRMQLLRERQKKS